MAHSPRGISGLPELRLTSASRIVLGRIDSFDTCMIPSGGAVI